MRENWCRIEIGFAVALMKMLNLAGMSDSQFWPGPFLCRECGHPVMPKGGPMPHFHHIGDGPQCSLRSN